MMELSKQVVSLPLAQKMKEMGFEQESLFWWVMKHPYSLVLPGPSWELVYTSQLVDWKEDEYIYCSAYTVAELGEIIAPHSHSFKSNDKWQCEYWFEVEDHTGNMDCDVFEADTEADARALCAIYLKEKGLI